MYEEKIKAVGKYRLAATEELSEDGKTIVCRLCHEPRYVAEYSPVSKCKVWHLAGGNNREIGEGCDCQRKTRLAKNARRFEYERAEYKTNDKGELIHPLVKVHPERSFAFDYGKYWMLEAVPEWGRQAMLSDVFYQDHYSESVKFLRTMLETLDTTGNMNQSFFVRGDAGSLKTSMLCCIRFKLLSNTVPTIMTNVWNLLKMMKLDQTRADEIAMVDYLLIDDIGKAHLNPTQAGRIEDLVSFRKRAEKPTSFGSLLTLDDLPSRGYTRQTIADIKAMDCDKDTKARSIAVVDLSDDSERVEF